MTLEEVKQLLNFSCNLRQQAIIQWFYSSGVRMEECTRIKLVDIDSKNMRIMVVQGKGRKVRYTLFSFYALTTLVPTFVKHCPATYLFEAKTKGRQVHCRSIQLRLSR